MTSTNTSNLDQAIVQFQNLPVEEQLAALGLLFKALSGSIPANAFGSAASQEIMPLIEQIKGMRQDEQLQTLSDFLANQTAQGNEVALDPHPSKAMLELIPGSTQPAMTRYESLNATSRLAFWYHLGQQLDNSIPTNSSLSPEAEQLITSLRSLSAEQQAAFLGQIA